MTERAVLDCSIAAAWYFRDEEDDYANAVLDSLAKGAVAIAPALWRYEIGNVITIGERRGRATPTETTDFLDMLDGLAIELVPEPSAKVMNEILVLTRQHRLSFYDASYLELAMREGAELASLDKPLNKAARDAGVRLYSASGS